MASPRKKKKAKKCHHCGKTFVRQSNVSRHMRESCKVLNGDRRFKCAHCPTIFKNRVSLDTHVERKHSGGVERLAFECGMCSKIFTTLPALLEHRRSHIQPARAHRAAGGEGGGEEDVGDSGGAFFVHSSAHGGIVSVHRYIFPDQVQQMVQAQRDVRQPLLSRLRRLRRQHNSFKARFSFTCEFIMMAEDGVTVSDVITPTFQCETFLLRPVENVERVVDEMFEDISNKCDDFIELGSGWIQRDMLFFDLNTTVTRPLSGSCSEHKVSISWDRKIAFHEDGFGAGDDGATAAGGGGGGGEFEDACFFLAVARGVLGRGAEHDAAALRDFVTSKLKRTVSTPVKIDDIRRFERANPDLGHGINVIYMCPDRKVYPTYVSLRPELPKQIVLALCQVEGAADEHGESTVHYHFANVDDPEKTLAPTYLRNDGSQRVYRKSQAVGRRFCFNCFNYMERFETYQRHVAWCHSQTGQRIVYPNKMDFVAFDNPKKEVLTPFSIFYDFESVQIKPDKVCSCPPEVIERSKLFDKQVELFGEEEATLMLEAEEQERRMERERTRLTSKNISWLAERFGEEEAALAILANRQALKELDKKTRLCKHQTKVFCYQEVFSYAAILVDREGKVCEKHEHYGDDSAEHLLHTLLNWGEEYRDKLSKEVAPIRMTDADNAAYAAAHSCYLCDRVLAGDRVRDHDHLSGRYLGAAHSKCNLARREESVIPAFAHNFSGYDSHPLVKAMERPSVRERLTRNTTHAIPLNRQKFKCMRLGNVKLLDSTAFLPAALDKLVSGLVESKHDWPLLKQHWPSPDDLDLLTRKGVYPYSYVTSVQQVLGTKHLPSRADFFNELGQTEVDVKDHQHAAKVWQHFGFTDLMQYTQHYNMQDTLQLAEAMVHFRNVIYKDFHLDAFAYLSLPQLSKDLFLKRTGVQMELISDPEMSHMLQTGIRGGVSYINTRLFDVAKEAVHVGERALTYVDVNNLYGQAMSLRLPLRGFRWLTEEEIADIDVLRDVDMDSDVGYIYEVDMVYPKHLHLSHNSFPLAPQTMDVRENNLSDYSKDVLNELHGKTQHKSTKLTGAFLPLEKYCVHGANLKLYLELGMEITKVHRAITFHQEPFMKEYIDYCTSMRASATTKAESNIYKLLANSLYGKMIESVANRMDCKFNFDSGNMTRRAMDPLYVGSVICGDELAISFHKKRELEMRQSWAVGFSILELSKWYMYELFYKRIRPVFGGRAGVLMSDTDSFILLTPCSSSDEVCDKMSDVMDYSTYDSKHKLYNADRKNKVGYLKNEVPKDEIVKFVGVRSKTYCYSTRGGTFDKRAKGVKRAYQRHLTLADFEGVINKVAIKRLAQRSIMSRNHQLRIVHAVRTVFSSFDDKRYLLCARHSAPYGSWLADTCRRTGACFFCTHPDVIV